jgi:hypothetical protein
MKEFGAVFVSVSAPGCAMTAGMLVLEPWLLLMRMLLWNQKERRVWYSIACAFRRKSA